MGTLEKDDQAEYSKLLELKKGKSQDLGLKIKYQTLLHSMVPMIVVRAIKSKT